MNIISNVKDKVLQAGYSNINQFCRETGANRSSIDRIWTGDITNRSLKVLAQVAIPLNCKIDDLFTIETNGAAN